MAQHQQESRVESEDSAKALNTARRQRQEMQTGLSRREIS